MISKNRAIKVRRVFYFHCFTFVNSFRIWSSTLSCKKPFGSKWSGVQTTRSSSYSVSTITGRTVASTWPTHCPCVFEVRIPARYIRFQLELLNLQVLDLIGSRDYGTFQLRTIQTRSRHYPSVWSNVIFISCDPILRIGNARKPTGTIFPTNRSIIFRRNEITSPTCISVPSKI